MRLGGVEDGCLAAIAADNGGDGFAQANSALKQMMDLPLARWHMDTAVMGGHSMVVEVLLVLRVLR